MEKYLQVCGSLKCKHENVFMSLNAVLNSSLAYSFRIGIHLRVVGEMKSEQVS